MNTVIIRYLADKDIISEHQHAFILTIPQPQIYSRVLQIDSSGYYSYWFLLSIWFSSYVLVTVQARMLWSSTSCRIGRHGLWFIIVVRRPAVFWVACLRDLFWVLYILVLLYINDNDTVCCDSTKRQLFADNAKLYSGIFELKRRRSAFMHR